MIGKHECGAIELFRMAVDSGLVGNNGNGNGNGARVSTFSC